MTSVEYPWNMPGKKWTLMTKEEQRQTYDIMVEMFKGLTVELEKDFNELLADGEAPMTVSVVINLNVDPNNDPRLP